MTGLLLQFNLWSQTSLTLNVETAGTLSSLIDASQKYEITDLTIIGNLNGTDILFIREMAGKDVWGFSTKGKLASLDLSGANIVSGGRYYDDYYTSNDIISNYMFFSTALRNVTLPNSVTSIGNYAFQSSGLTSITIGNSVTSIGDYAFSGCSGLTSVSIPNNVTSIGNSAFWGCSSLKEFVVLEQNQNYSSIDGVLFNKDKTTIITCPQGKSGVYTIPNSVTLINGAFFGCTGLTSITIPNSVTSIGNSAFSGCTGLTSITIPNSVAVIGGSAFSDCSGLTSITIPNSVTAIGGYAFLRCNTLTSITIGNSVNSIGGSAFSGCNNLVRIYSKNPIPPSVYGYTGGYSFSDATKKACRLYIPIGSYALYLRSWGFDNIIETDFDVTAINPINKDNTAIKSIANGIAIETKETTPVSVFNLSGQKVYQSVINGNTEIPLNKGVYIVKMKNESEKIIIK